MKKIINIYITGANGFIGKTLINYLKNIKEYKVIGISYSKSNCFINDTIYSDYEDTEWLKDNIINNSILIHTAAYIPKNQQDYLNTETFDTNIKIDKFIVDVFHNFVVKIIYFSTISVYGYGYKNLYNITEDSPISISDYYSKGKLIGERLIQNKFKNKEYILRLSSPYGIGKNNLGILEKTIYKAINNEEIEIYGEGERTQDYIYISDICKVIIKLIVFNHKTGIYNLASGNACKMSELIKIITNILKSNSKIINVDKQESPSVHINNKKLCKELSMNFVDLEEGIYELYNFIKQKVNK